MMMMELNHQRAPERWAAETRQLIVGGADGILARIAEQFQELGWAVHQAHSAAEVRQLAGEVPAGVVILPTEFAQESGWLTCAKLVREYPDHKVILVSDYTTPDRQRYTSFVGGTALLGLDSSMRSLVDEVYAAAELPEAN